MCIYKKNYKEGTMFSHTNIPKAVFLWWQKKTVKPNKQIPASVCNLL